MLFLCPKRGDNENLETKICTKCGEEFNINEFSKDKRHKDGLGSWCKSCVNKNSTRYHKENKEKELEKCKKYRDDNRNIINEKSRKRYGQNIHEESERKKLFYIGHSKEILERCKEYRDNNLGKETIRHKIYNTDNKEKIAIWHKSNYGENLTIILERNKQYYKINSKHLLDCHKRWKKENLDKVCIYSQVRRAKKFLLPFTLTIKQWENIKLSFNNRCAYCGKELPLTQEHFIALSKGGEYTHNNIIPSCQSCNSSKNDKDFFLWYPKYEYYNKKREQIILKFLNYKDNNQQLTIML